MGVFETMVDAITEGLRIDKFDHAFVEKLRVDFRTLMANFDRLKTNSDLRTLVDGLKRWNSYLNAMMSKGGDYDDEFAFPGSIHEFMLKVAKGAVDAGVVPEHQAATWYNTSSAQVNEYAESLYKALQFPKEWLKTKVKITAPPDMLRQLVTNARAYASELFELLDGLADTVATFEKKIGKAPPPLKTAIRQAAEIEGFPCVVRGYDPDEPTHKTMMQLVRQGLADFRRKATDRFPLLLKIMKRANIHFDCPPGMEGVYYHESQTINICASRIFEYVNTAAEFTKVLAHETSHRLYFAVLSAESRKVWEAAFKSDQETLDLQKVMDAWPPSVDDTNAAVQVIGKTDPKMAMMLQLITGFGIDVGNATFSIPAPTRGIFMAVAAQAMKDRKVKKIKVPKHPVSAYGATSAGEAFAEVGGFLVALGPKAVNPVALDLFRIITGTK